MVQEINEQEFEEKAKGKCIIDFFATWCPPCKILSPVFEEVSKEYDNVSFYKINVDENLELSNKYNIMHVPTLVLMENGKIIKKVSGAMNNEQLKDFIENE